MPKGSRRAKPGSFFNHGGLSCFRWLPNLEGKSGTHFVTLDPCPAPPTADSGRADCAPASPKPRSAPPHPAPPARCGLRLPPVAAYRHRRNKPTFLPCLNSALSLRALPPPPPRFVPFHFARPAAARWHWLALAGAACAGSARAAQPRAASSNLASRGQAAGPPGGQNPQTRSRRLFSELPCSLFHRPANTG